MRRRPLLAGVAVAAAAATAVLVPVLSAEAGTAAPAVAAAPDIAVANVKAHLSQFQSIASSNGGNRYAGGRGYTASVAYVEQKLTAAGYTVTKQACTSCTASSQNVIAEWRGGDANQVFMLGAHLDSVSAGPGINDNGSGSAGILEVALQLAQRNPTMTKRVRFAWWADEEQGLRGSNFYVSRLSATERARIKGYLNFDMIGSRNAGYFVNNITTPLARTLTAYYDSIGVQTEENVEGANRSDDASFRNAGIPTSGVAAGASARKTSAQAQKWGGTANAAYDSCYHSSCDTTSNIADVPLGRAANAISTALWAQAVGGDTPPTSTPPAGNAFSIAVSPSAGSVTAGDSTSAVVSTTTTSGNPQNVQLSVSGAPAGVTASVSPNSVTSGASATLNISTAATTASGVYTLTVTGTGTNSTQTATYRLTVGTVSTPPSSSTPQPPGCNGVSPWGSSTSYVPGDKVSYNGHQWEATWYSTGAEPGAPGSWAVWKDAGAC